MPYAMMISVVVGVTALIPMFGAFIGAGIGAFLILMVDPMQAVWFFDLYCSPSAVRGELDISARGWKICGTPRLWVLVAVTIGGNLWGVMGIFLLSVPVCSVVYSLFRQLVRDRLKKKSMCRCQRKMIRKTMDGQAPQSKTVARRAGKNGAKKIKFH